MGSVPNRGENVGRQLARIAAREGRPVRVPANVGTHIARMAAREPGSVGRPAAQLGGGGRRRAPLASARAARMSAAAAVAPLVPRRGGARGVWQGRLGGSVGAHGAASHGRLSVQAVGGTGGRSWKEGRPIASSGAAAFPPVSRVARTVAAAAERQGRMDRHAAARSLRGDGFAGATSRGTAGGRTHQLGNGGRDSAAHAGGSRRHGGQVER